MDPLAGIDLLDDLLGPVLTSIIIFQNDQNGFKSLNFSYTFCHFFNWISSFLRLSPSFIATLMALATDSKLIKTSIVYKINKKSRPQPKKSQILIILWEDNFFKGG